MCYDSSGDKGGDMEITTLRLRRFEYIIGFKDNTYTIGPIAYC